MKMRIHAHFLGLVLFTYTTVELSDCRQCINKKDPLTVNPACPHSPSNMNEAGCNSLDTKCCWNSTSDGTIYPKCYYTPDKPVYNVALGRPTFMKNIWRNDTRVISSNGVDGCTNNDLLRSGCCFHTAVDRDTWWTVDLEDQYLIVAVTVTTRNSFPYTKDFKIELSNTSHDPYNQLNRQPGALTVCADHPQVVPVATTERILCVSITAARYVIIHKTTTGQPPLFLCEVQVETVGRFNIALGKVVTLSSTYKGGNFAFDGFKAVDGCFGESFRTSCCAHTDWYQVNPWLVVDLGEIYTVYSVTIVNSRDGASTLQNLEIVLSNDTSNFSVPCVKEAIPTIGLTETKNIKCSNPITAKYVRVLRQTNRPGVLLVCELEVEAACRYNRYGKNCWYECHCKDQVACDLVTGICPNGLCIAGFQGEKCDIPCHSGHYGENCLSNCSMSCRNATVCDPVSGVCPDGCKDGYASPLCKAHCPKGSYGQNCLKSCSGNCLNDEVCDHVDGHCPRGCSAGYQGWLCNTSCNTGTYGRNCVDKCSINCLNTTSCDHTSGECPFGCVNEYEGLTCENKVTYKGEENESSKKNQSDSNGIVIGTAVGFAFGVLLTIVITIVLIIIRRKQNSKPKKDECGSEKCDNQNTVEPVPNSAHPGSSSAQYESCNMQDKVNLSASTNHPLESTQYEKLENESKNNTVSAATDAQYITLYDINSVYEEAVVKEETDYENVP